MSFAPTRSWNVALRSNSLNGAGSGVELGRVYAETNQPMAQFLTISTRIGQFASEWTGLGVVFDEIWPEFDAVWPAPANFGQRPDLAEFGQPMATKFGPKLTKRGLNFANI